MDPLLADWTKVHNPKTGNDEMRRLHNRKTWSVGLTGSSQNRTVEAEKLPEKGCDHVYVFDIDMFEVPVTVVVLNATPLNALVILNIFVP